MPIHGKSSQTWDVSSSNDQPDVRIGLRPGKIIRTIHGSIAYAVSKFYMSTLKKTLKAGIIAGACGIGLCALARRLKLGTRIADFAHSVEAVPFPGTRLYAFLASRQMRPLYVAIAEEIVSSGKFQRILDLNTGAGYLPIEIALRSQETQVSGIDESGEMIQLAETNAHASRVGKSVELAVGDPTNLPFPGRYFDLVVSVNVLHHWKEPMAVFEEIFHILTPGGQLWIYDYRKDISPEVWESLQKGLPAHQRLALLFGPIPSSKAAYSKAELLEMAAETHFEHPILEERTLPLFGRPMPVFNVLKLHKPDQNRE